MSEKSFLKEEALSMKKESEFQKTKKMLFVSDPDWYSQMNCLIQ